jgi:hypothetical protein
MKKITLSFTLIFFSFSCFAVSNPISKMTCGVHIQKKAGGENKTILLPGSEVKAITYKGDKNSLTSKYKGNRFSYSVYAEKNVPSKAAPDLLISFNDTKEGVKVWSPQGRSSSGNYTVSINEIKKKEPIYYLKCKTE